LTAAAVRDEIDAANSRVSPADEEKTMKLLSYQATSAEMMRFKNYLWDFDSLDHHDDYMRSLPITWQDGGSL